MDTEIDWDKWDGARCCKDDFGGSHYHCAVCGMVCGSHGHLACMNPSANILPEQFVAWPADRQAKFNSCAKACDMWTGPCCCGAWHKDGE